MRRMRRNRKITTALVETRICCDRDGGFRALTRQQFDGRPLRRELQFSASPEQVAASGGAVMYCPSCRALRRCDAITFTQLGLETRKRQGLGGRPEINWSRRVRMCRSCFYHFITAEVSESLILEMGEMLDEKAGGGEEPGTGESTVIPFPRGGRRR
jgi:hypothetical protein